MSVTDLRYVYFIFVSEEIYSHCVVGLNLDWICRISSREKVTPHYPACSILVQSNYIDGRSSQTLFSALVDSISLKCSLLKRAWNRGVTVGIGAKLRNNIKYFDKDHFLSLS